MWVYAVVVVVVVEVNVQPDLEDPEEAEIGLTIETIDELVMATATDSHGSGSKCTAGARRAQRQQRLLRPQNLPLPVNGVVRMVN